MIVMLLPEQQTGQQHLLRLHSPPCQNPLYSLEQPHQTSPDLSALPSAIFKNIVIKINAKLKTGAKLFKTTMEGDLTREDGPFPSHPVFLHGIFNEFGSG